MLYPRGICLFPLLPPIPSFHKVSLFTGSSFKIASRRQSGGGGGGGVGEEEESSLALLAFAQLINQSINQSINQLYLNTVNGSASWFSDMPCDNYNL